MKEYVVRVGAVYGYPDYIRTIQASSCREAIQKVVATMPSSEGGWRSCRAPFASLIITPLSSKYAPSSTQFIPD